MPKKMGRPKLPKKQYKGDVFSVRVSGDEAKAIWAAIDGSGKTKPLWMREALLAAARARRPKA